MNSAAPLWCAGCEHRIYRTAVWQEGLAYHAACADASAGPPAATYIDHDGYAVDLTNKESKHVPDTPMTNLPGDRVCEPKPGETEIERLRRELLYSQRMIGVRNEKILMWKSRAKSAEGKARHFDIDRHNRELAAARAELAKLRAFKAYVHARLDEAGVPTNPDSPHTAAGCRVGGRLDLLLGWIAAGQKVPSPSDQLYEVRHPDDAAVVRFSLAMREKLAKKRGDGYGGWDDPQECSVEHLTRLLLDHIKKGGVVDIANFCMMLHQRGTSIADWGAGAGE